jgi:hypothetical protein
MDFVGYELLHFVKQDTEIEIYSEYVSDSLKGLNFKRRVKSHRTIADIISSSPYSPR